MVIFVNFYASFPWFWLIFCYPDLDPHIWFAGEVKIGGEVTNKIYYEPDSGDDWDDEDPDDDLDL